MCHKRTSVSVGGLVVEFSPATRETGVRFPVNAHGWPFLLRYEDVLIFKQVSVSLGSAVLIVFPRYHIFVINMQNWTWNSFPNNFRCGLVARIWRFHRHVPGFDCRHAKNVHFLYLQFEKHYHKNYKMILMTTALIHVRNSFWSNDISRI